MTSAGRGGLARGGEDLPERDQHPDTCGRQPRARGDRDALPGHDPLRTDRERKRQITGIRSKHDDRQQIAKRQPKQRGQPAEHDRIEQQRLDDVQARRAVGAQPGDQPLAQRERQQHRVERKQEPDERADPREQALTLVGRRRRDPEESHIEVGRLDVQAARGQPLKTGSHLELPSRYRLYVDTCNAPPHTGQLLRVGQRRDRDRAMREPTDRGRVERRADQCGDVARADLQLDRLQRLRPDLFGNRSRQRESMQTSELGVVEMLQQRAVSKRQTGIGADQFNGLPAGRPNRVGGPFKQRQGGTDAGQLPHLPKQAFVNARGSRDCSWTGALLTSGGVDCWGGGGDGALGTGSTGDSSTPAAVLGVGGTGELSDVLNLASNGSGYCALIGSGAVQNPGGVDCWGIDSGGALGDGSYTNPYSASPVEVEGVGGAGTLGGVQSLVGFGVGYCALLTTEEVDCWGWNSDLGAGPSTTTSDVPVQVVDVDGAGLLSSVSSLVGDAPGASQGICAVLTSGGVDCLGAGYAGQLGNGTFTTDTSTPVAALGLGSGGNDAIALTGDGTGFCAVLTWVGLTAGETGQTTFRHL